MQTVGQDLPFLPAGQQRERDTAAQNWQAHSGEFAMPTSRTTMAGKGSPQQILMHPFSRQPQRNNLRATSHHLGMDKVKTRLPREQAMESESDLLQKLQQMQTASIVTGQMNSQSSSTPLFSQERKLGSRFPQTVTTNMNEQYIQHLPQTWGHKQAADMANAPLPYKQGQRKNTDYQETSDYMGRSKPFLHKSIFFPEATAGITSPPADIHQQLLALRPKLPFDPMAGITTAPANKHQQLLSQRAKLHSDPMAGIATTPADIRQQLLGKRVKFYSNKAPTYEDQLLHSARLSQSTSK